MAAWLCAEGQRNPCDVAVRLGVRRALAAVSPCDRARWADSPIPGTGPLHL